MRGRGRGQRDWKHEKDLTATAGFGNGRRDPQTKECRLSLEAENGPRLTVSKETGTSVLKVHEMEFCQNPKELGSGVIPRATERNTVLTTPWLCLCETLSREPAEPHCVRTSTYRKWEIINLYCFKPLNLW